ncbi:MAG TPA: CRTAC1 family protein [Planctomycetota bacterium]
MINLRTLFVLAFAAAPLAALPAQGVPTYTNRTNAAGVAFTHGVDLPGGFGSMTTQIVAGGSVADFNRDGWPDLFVLGGGEFDDALFINQQDGTFVNEAANWGLTVGGRHHGIGAVAGDVDVDGWVDLFVTSFGPVGAVYVVGSHKLFRNTGQGGFVEMAAAAGVATSATVKPDGYGAAFGDYDRDGDLDLFVAGWEQGNEGNRMFQNDGSGHFTDVTVAAGLFDVSINGFVPTIVDMDGDLWPDLILIADQGTSQYFANNRDGTFTKLSPRPDRFFDLAGMGCAVADFDNDLDLDFYASSIDWGPSTVTGNGLYWNAGAHNYVESAHQSGVHEGGWGWGVLATDCENDGWLDLMETNGWRQPPYDNFPTRMWVNNRDHTFTDVAIQAGIVHYAQGRTLMRLDYDRDGDEDLVLLANRGALQLYRNENSPSGGHSVRLSFDTSANPGLAPDGLGTRVIARAASGKRVMRVLDGGQSFLGNSEFVVHVGMGTETRLRELEIRWADGSYTMLGDVAADQRLTVSSGLPIQAGEFRRGTTVDVTAQGAMPGEFVLFLYSVNGLANGACPPPLGGLCFDIAPPVRFLAAANSDPSGAVRVSLPIPSGAPLGTVAVQGVIPRGTGGSASVKTNAVLRTILP